MKVKRVQGAAGKRLEKALKFLKGKTGKVGWGKDARYENGPPVAYVAAIQEYGSIGKNIPARPFIRPTIMKQQKAWAIVAEDMALRVINGKATVADAMEAIGRKAAGDIRKAITLVYSPALAEQTVMARIRKNKALSTVRGQLSLDQIGNITKPLIDTGIMMGTLTNVVEDDE